MRFHLGPIVEDFEPDASWRSICEPGPILLQFLAFPVGVVSAVAVGFAWHLLGTAPRLAGSGSYAVWMLVGLALSFPALILVHELLHGVVHPGYGFTNATVIGAWPSRLLFYAHYCGPLTRERFLWVFAMPTLVITGLPLVAAAAGLLPPAVMPVAAWFSTWNAFFACGDAIGMALIFWQVPRGAVVQNKGWLTFWKPADGTTEAATLES